MRIRVMMIGLLVAMAAAGYIAGQEAKRSQQQVTNAPERAGKPDRRPEDEIRGPLRVHSTNPRYFTDDGVRAVFLTGSHTWPNLVDMWTGETPQPFDFNKYLDWMKKYDHNFIRLWAWDNPIWDRAANLSHAPDRTTLHVAPFPWARTGPGQASDGKPKFDLTKFDPEYFRRLRSRIEAAGARGIYVSVMLFEGWSKHRMKDAFRTHPFHPANNVNGMNADTNGDGIGFETIALENPKVVAIQERYVSKVVDTINDLDNALYEIANESHGNSTAWQYHMIEFVRKYEKRKPKQHPIGITFLYTGGSDEALFRSSADWISPSMEGGYLTDPPPNAGSKVILSDTDHLGGLAGDQQWVWKSFLRGLNCIFMDPYDGAVLGLPFDPQWEPVRVNMGYVRRFANRLDLAAMRPRGELSSTRYCLTDAAAYLRRPGKEYLVYLPDGGGAQVDLSAAKGHLAVEWFNPSTGKTIVSDAVEGGRRVGFQAPFSGDAVLYLRAK